MTTQQRGKRNMVAKLICWRSSRITHWHRGYRMKEVTITRQQYRNVCDALLNTANLNEQLLLLSTADKRSEKIHRQSSKLLQKFASNFRKPWEKNNEIRVDSEILCTEITDL